MMYQMHKNHHIISQEINDIIALISKLATINPTSAQKSNLDFKQVFSDFVKIQARALSLVVYFQNNKEMLNANADLLVEGIVQLFKNCPPELASARKKDLLAIPRHITSDLRPKIHMSDFFDEFSSDSYTASESLSSNASCRIVAADIVHNLRNQLTYADLCQAINYFSKCLQRSLMHSDDAQRVWNMVLLSLIDCVKEQDHPNIKQQVLKFKPITLYQVAPCISSLKSQTNKVENRSVCYKSPKQHGQIQAKIIGLEDENRIIIDSSMKSHEESNRINKLEESIRSSSSTTPPPTQPISICNLVNASSSSPLLLLSNENNIDDPASQEQQQPNQQQNDDSVYSLLGQPQETLCHYNSLPSFKELASEGEQLCKMGDFKNGVKYFEEALKLFNYDKINGIKSKTTDDVNSLKQVDVLSIIYNQMGNAYFYMQDYSKALDFHKKDLELCEILNDDLGRAKSCGNIGNTLQLLGDFDEAIFFLLKSLEISTQLNNTNSEARSCYNLGNIYQAKGKHMGRLIYNRDVNDFKIEQNEIPNEIKETLFRAIYYYRKTLDRVRDKDRSAEGRTYGNLGNTYYLLGDFEAAIQCHAERLHIAKEYGDKAAERRAYSNLGNAYIFQGQFSEAADYYTKALYVAKSLGDKAIEAQSCYSLGNAYILLQDYSVAIDFHLRHLHISQQLGDKVSESKAYWSLGNAYAALNDFENACNYAQRHLNIARVIGDSNSELTAKKNLFDFQHLLSNSCSRDCESALFTPVVYKKGTRRLVDQSITKSVSIDSFYANTSTHNINKKLAQPETPLRYINQNIRKHNQFVTSNEEENEEEFFNILTRMQSSRIDDQRCSSSVRQATNAAYLISEKNRDKVEELQFFDFILRSQNTRLDDQRTCFTRTPSERSRLGNNQQCAKINEKNSQFPVLSSKFAFFLKRKLKKK